MSTRAIRTSTSQTACDVCGRTLLRGEHSEVYLAGGTRHPVCELCTSRALHGGWVREGTVPAYDPAGERDDRRRSLLGRRRPRRRPELDTESEPQFPDLSPPLSPLNDGSPPDTSSMAPEAPGPSDPELVADPLPDGGPARGPVPDWPDPPARAPRRMRRRRTTSGRSRPDPAAGRDLSPSREPRHVHAVPTLVDHKIEAAIELFNGSEHPRTVAGITRSLGLPDVSVHPSSPVAAIVNVVVCWELCWYRYEVDLSEVAPVVRGAGQGYELAELTELERHVNATADDLGRLSADR
jgi:hypothetical protein